MKIAVCANLCCDCTDVCVGEIDFCLVIDVATPSDKNVIQNEAAKMLKYRVIP
jgi:hypothetical protein